MASAAGPVNILYGISPGRAQPARRVALTGPSGSGKSSLLMVAAGLERPSGGRVDVAGTDITDMGEDALARFRRGRVGIVFQSFHLIPTMTALENVAVPLELVGAADAFDARRAGIAKRWGWPTRTEHYPGQLSGGEQQRVALARAMAPQAADPVRRRAHRQSRQRQWRGHRRSSVRAAMRERGATLFLVTHEESLARRCQRIVRLKDGRIVADRMSAPWPGMTGIALAWQLARRELRGGLSGFRIFFLCLLLGAAAIAGVESLSDAFLTGLRDQGRLCWAAMSRSSWCIARPRADERAFLARYGTRLRQRLDARHGLCAAETASRPSASWSN